jgi:hypothetical protein
MLHLRYKHIIFSYMYNGMNEMAVSTQSVPRSDNFYASKIIANFVAFCKVVSWKKYKE